jgi:hypothetical protein
VKEFDVSAEDEDPDWADIEPDPELALKATDFGEQSLSVSMMVAVDPLTVITREQSGETAIW